MRVNRWKILPMAVALSSWLSFTACGGDDSQSVNECAFVSICNSGAGVCYKGAVLLSNHAISADFSGSDSTGSKWSGHATATYNNLGNIATYTVTVNGQTCSG